MKDDVIVWRPWVALAMVAALTLPAWTAPAVAGPSARAYVEQAIPLANRGQCARAVELLRRAVALDRRYVRAHTWLGFCYAKMGRNRDAIAAFNRVIALAPNADDARFARAWLDRLQPPAAARPTPSRPTPPVVGAQPGVVYLVSLPAAAGLTDASRPRAVQLFGMTYRRALVERRNWWQGRRPAEREWRVVYNLQRRYSRFRAVAGVEDGTPPEFTAIFEVRGDGTTLFVGTPKRAGDVPDTIEIDVSGVLQLELIVVGKDRLHTRDLSVIWGDPFVDARPGPARPAIPSPAGPSPAAPASPTPAGSQVTPPASPPASPTPRGSRPTHEAPGIGLV
ncbi:MAG: NPCBM/NEW2 domain-containing protein [Armatimonadota bacterium]|nr:NPCBM/NEW2 domain-containing protein [Armatimonadota bacterium]